MAQFEEAAGIARILEVVNFWIESLRKTAYKEAKYGDFAGLKWALITLFEGSDILVNKNDDIKLATFKTMRNLFDMINYIHSVVHESEPPEPKLIPNKKEKYLLGSILNITLYDKSEGTAYTESSVEELIQSKSDMRIYSILLQVAELTLLLMNELAQYYSMQEPLALSGWSWIGLYHALCCDSPNYLYLKNFFETEQLQILSLAITRYSCGFSLKMKGSIDVFDTFEPTLSKLMSKHVFNQLVSGIEIVGLRIKEPPVTEVLVMLRQILEKLNKEIEHPNFLWTKESHNELKAALRDHLATVFKMPEMTKDNFMGKLVNFEYKSYEGEIMIDSVFVRVINKDPYMPLDNVAEFFKAALIELSKVNPLEKDERLLHKTLMIVEALDNVAVYQKGIEQIGLSMDHVEILLKFVTPPAITLRPGLEIIRSHVFSIFVEASKESKCVSTMLQNPDFTLAVLYHLCNIPNTPVAHLTLTIVQGLSRHSNATGALIAYGYVIGLLAIAFDDNIDKKYRTKAVEILVKVLIQGKSEPKHNILNDYVPHYILEQLTERWSKEAEEVLYFIDHDHRDAYIIWNSVLRARTKEILKDEAKKISVTIEKGYKIPWADMKKEYSINKYVNEGEVVVEGVVLSNFIKFPAIKLKKPLNKFLENLNEAIIISLSLLNQYQSDPGNEKLQIPANLGEEQKVSIKTHEENFQAGVLCMATALLVAYEQMFRNAFNPNKSVLLDPLQRKSVVPTSPPIALADSIKSIICMGLRTSNTVELNITLLELLCLVCEQKKLLEKDELKVVTVSVIQCLYEDAAPGSEPLEKCR